MIYKKVRKIPVIDKIKMADDKPIHFLFVGNILYIKEDKKTDITLIDYDYSSYNYRCEHSSLHLVFLLNPRISGNTLAGDAIFCKRAQRHFVALQA